MTLSTKGTKLEQALDHSQHHAQAKNMAANLREKHTLIIEFGQTIGFVCTGGKTAGDVRKGSSICKIQFRQQIIIRVVGY